jgi:cell division protein FtsQ
MNRAAGVVAGQLVRLPKIVPFFVLSIPARFRRKLGVALVVAVVLTAGYMLWLRDSSLVAIEKVQVTGLTTRDAPKVREALTAAARDMTTLHVDRERLLESASAWPVVNDLRVVADFPHGVRIEAVERRPVALVTAGGGRVAVSEDGTVIRGLKGAPELPQADRKLVAVAGAAPPSLLERVKAIRVTDRGVVAELAKGPEVVLGAQTRLRAKWAAAAAVMADGASAGAAYVDVRLPERPVAGGLPEPGPEVGGAEETVEPATPQPAPEPLTPQPQP